MLVAGSSKL